MNVERSCITETEGTVESGEGTVIAFSIDLFSPEFHSDYLLPCSIAFRTLPYWFSNALASSYGMFKASITIRVPRSMSFTLLSCISTMRFPFTRPKRIITDVEIIFSISFCAVPDFIRVIPVTNSGPTSATNG